MTIVRPDKLVLCVDPLILHDARDEVVAVVAALSRGYTQAQLEPDEAVATMRGRRSHEALGAAGRGGADLDGGRVVLRPVSRPARTATRQWPRPRTRKIKVG